jgi:hypothetical protein
MSDKFEPFLHVDREWVDIDVVTFSQTDLDGDYDGEFFGTSFGKPIIKNNPFYFYVESHSKSDKIDIYFYRDQSDILSYEPYLKFKFNGEIDVAKKLVENTVVHFTEQEFNKFSLYDIKIHLNAQIDMYKKNQQQDRQLETAQKTGYVQGVCESVLAFNNEDNRKIMTESTMVFLSKKLLSEMNVTKDAAQKFARPETYKALEQCVFSSEQNRNLEQTQTRARGL